VSGAVSPMRIVIVCELSQGANSYAFARAFRRMGHSVVIVSEQMFVGFGWRSFALKAARKALSGAMAADFNSELIDQAEALRPHLLFVCKGTLVAPETIDAVKATGATAILWWPDVSFMVHGATVPKAMPRYDWIFTTKTFGLADMRNSLGVSAASFMPHAYDPETHAPAACDADDVARYACDVSFIGTWSPKKQALLEALVTKRPQTKLKIWGAQWGAAGAILKPSIMDRGVFGTEYAKAIGQSKINLAALSEVRAGASMGDLITSRTFHIPAAGGFMLHERTSEIGDYFHEGEECAMYSDADEMIAKIDHYLASPEVRQTIAAKGRARCLASPYSIDDRAREVLAKTATLRGGGLTPSA